jgi:hypothetical protein
MLMAVERLREFVEVWIAWIEPAWASKSVPVTLSNNVRARMKRSKVGGDNAIVSGQNRCNFKSAQSCNQLLRRVRSLLKKLHGDRSLKATHISHQLPVLVRRLNDPVTNRLIGVASVSEGLVENQVHAALDEDGVCTA